MSSMLRKSILISTSTKTQKLASDDSLETNRNSIDVCIGDGCAIMEHRSQTHDMIEVSKR